MQDLAQLTHMKTPHTHRTTMNVIATATIITKASQTKCFTLLMKLG
jgi:hypothetical protein